MTEKVAQSLNTIPVSRPVEESRMLPLAVAGSICFVIAVALGYGSWYFFGSHTWQKTEQRIFAELPPSNFSNPEQPVIAPAAIEAPAPSPAAEIVENPKTETPKAVNPAVEGTVSVEGGEFAIGGGTTKQPLKRSIVGNFAVAETEVTNAQYAEFIRETGHPPPPHWTKNNFPENRADYPVVNVSYKDAAAFCRWKEKKVGAPVRLPTETEWELAARGRTANKYPWGNDWDEEAANFKENGGKITPVKNFPLNRSPFGAFDMAGNVWEWTQDKVANNGEVTDAEVKKALAGGKVLRIVKGGTALDKAAQISAQARYEIPENAKNAAVGFRYVVVREK